ncbi:MAG TPA: carboxypeptidase-like regulatory domain-containing protein [Mycobacteriales bacterium]|nr:carboxypeptidase-like regulatory domain-containing protein [Mycobacteriales bacterium]
MKYVVAAAAVGALLIGGAVSAYSAPAHNAPAIAASPARDLTLPTGDQVRVSTAPGGRESVVAQPVSGRREVFTARRINGDLFVIPSVAQPFLGTGLDPALFDVSQLAKSGNRTPVQFSGTTPAGVTRTGDGTGYLTSTSAATFGAALRRQLGHAAATGWHDPLALPGGTTEMRLSGADSPPPTVHPDYDMWTVKLRVLDASGKPAPDASVVLMNTDDGPRYNDSPPIFDGSGRASVPAGNYSALAEIYDADASGEPTAVRQVSIADIAVTKNTTVTLDSRKARKVSVSTPRPADTQDVTLDWERIPADGQGGIDSQALVGAGIATYDAPTDYATVGQLHYAAVMSLTSPASSPAPYTYDVAFPSDGAVPTTESYRVTTATLTTLHARYFTDTPGLTATTGRSALLGNGLVGLSFSKTFTLPLSRTEYVTGDPAVAWQDSVSPDPGATPTADVPRIYPAGGSRNVDWFHGPLVPGFGSDSGASQAFACPACRNGTKLDLTLAPTVDSTPGHTEVPFLWGGVHTIAATHLVLSQGKTVLADSTSGLNVAATAPSAAAAPYTLSVDETRQTDWVRQSTASHTEWTFTSAAPTTTALPPAWTCLTDSPCSVLPLLTVNYQLQNDIDGTAPAGPDRLDLTLGHLPGAAAAPITAAKVSVSFDDGATWTPTIFASQGAGHYRARWTNPASVSGGDVAFQVTGRDAAGATVTQVVHHALTIQPATAARSAS